MDNTIKTNISQAYWYSPDRKDEVEIARFKPDGDGIAWLDMLLEGGLYIPTQRNKDCGRPLTLLLMGPPGTGKTTLALELCYRLALDKFGFDSFFISAEAEAWKLLDKAGNYGWDTKAFYAMPENIASKEYKVAKKAKKTNKRAVIWGAREIFESYIRGLDRDVLETDLDAQESSTNLIDTLSGLSSPVLRLIPYFLGNESQELAKKFIDIIDKVISESEKSKNDEPNLDDGRIDLKDYGVVVVDSLNNIPDEKTRAELFSTFLSSVSGGPRIVVFILDSFSSNQGPKFWEHVCDVVIRMGYHYEETSKYLIRDIEIVKARYQTHVWGKHQLKIYPGHETNLQSAKREPRPESLKPQSHPYRKEGGVFIYPSIHWFLSRYKRQAPIQKHIPMKTPLSTLNRILGGGGNEDIEGGLPRGRCTAMIGSRGAHKSHLGYYHILNSISRNEDRATERERGLIISLRDDEGLAKDAMISLLATSPMAGPKQGLDSNPEETLNNHINNNDLEILYFPPGYITPEEFYHRVMMSLLRLKQPIENETVKITVLFNSLDQLSARFPLCAKEDIFIPGLIDTFTAENVTSIFIAVDEPGQPPHQYGLLTMADLILSFRQKMFRSKDYFGHINSIAENEDNLDDIREKFGKKTQAVELRVERFSGGQRAGEGGILELVQKEPLEELYKKLFKLTSRLVFIPFSPNHKQGK